jgi:hypothetical protein
MYSSYSILILLFLSVMPLSNLWSESFHQCDGYTTYEMSYNRLKTGEYDCTERTDTGYVSGDSFPIIVVNVDGKPAELQSANAYWVMKQAALIDGIDLQISSAFRTWAEQEYLYNCYLNQNCNNGNLAASPGYSNHQSGHAFDLNTSDDGVLNWLNNHGARFGFERTVSSEPWHWEWWGGGPGGGPCTSQPCQVIGADGGLLDDSGPCFQKFGSMMYWRQVNGEGEEGSLHWTNAYDADSPSNWARWQIHLSEGGEYLLEVSISTDYGICTQTPYLVKHGEDETTLILDQSTPEYWQILGTFSFTVEGTQYVDVYDNIPGWSLQNQHITADAIRLTRQRSDNPNIDIAGMEVNTEPMTSGDEMNMDMAGEMGEDRAGSSNESEGGVAGEMGEQNEGGESSSDMVSEDDEDDEGMNTNMIEERPQMGGDLQQALDLENDPRTARGGVSCSQLNNDPNSPLSTNLYHLLLCVLYSLSKFRCRDRSEYS